MWILAGLMDYVCRPLPLIAIYPADNLKNNQGIEINALFGNPIAWLLFVMAVTYAVC